MKTRKAKKMKKMKTKKMRGGIISKNTENNWHLDAATVNKVSTPTVNKYRELEISVLNKLAKNSDSPNSNAVLERETILEKNYRDMCETAKSNGNTSTIKTLKDNIASIINLRYEESIDRLRPQETSEERIKRENHETRLTLWKKKYTIIKNLFNEVQRALHKPPDKEELPLREKLELIEKNLASVEQDFPEANKKLKGLQLVLQFFPESKDRHDTLQRFNEKSAEVMVSLKDLVFKFNELKEVVDSTTVFSERLLTLTQKSPTLEEVVEFSELLQQFIEQKEREYRSTMELFSKKKEKIEEILKKKIIEEQEQERLEKAEEERLEQEEQVRLEKERAERAEGAEALLQSRIGGPPPKGPIRTTDELVDDEVAKNVKYIESINTIMSELQAADHTQAQIELIQRTIKRYDISENHRDILVFYMRTLLFDTCMNIITIIKILSGRDPDFLRKHLDEFDGINDDELRVAIKKFVPSDTVESLILPIIKNIGEDIPDLLIRFHVFVYYLYQYLRLSRPNLSSFPKITDLDKIAKGSIDFDKRETYYVGIMTSIWLNYRTSIKEQLPVFKKIFKEGLTNTFLMEEAKEAESKGRAAESRRATDETLGRLLSEKVKQKNDLTGSIATMKIEINLKHERMLDLNERINAIILSQQKNTAAELISFRSLIRTLSQITAEQKKGKNGDTIRAAIISKKKQILTSDKLIPKNPTPLNEEDLDDLESQMTEVSALQYELDTQTLKTEFIKAELDKTKQDLTALGYSVTEKSKADEQLKKFLGLLKQKKDELVFKVEELKKKIPSDEVDDVYQFYINMESSTREEATRFKKKLDRYIAQMKNGTEEYDKYINDLVKTIEDLRKTEKAYDIKKEIIEIESQTGSIAEADLRRSIIDSKLKASESAETLDDLTATYEGVVAGYAEPIKKQIAIMTGYIYEIMDLSESEKAGPRSKELLEKINGVRTKLVEDGLLANAEVSERITQISLIGKKKRVLAHLTEIIKDQEKRLKGMSGGLTRRKLIVRKKTRRVKR